MYIHLESTTVLSDKERDKLVKEGREQERQYKEERQTERNRLTEGKKLKKREQYTERDGKEEERDF